MWILNARVCHFMPVFMVGLLGSIGMFIEGIIQISTAFGVWFPHVGLFLSHSIRLIPPRPDSPMIVPENPAVRVVPFHLVEMTPQPIARSFTKAL